MKLRILQALFVGVFLCFAALVVHHGRPRLLPPRSAQAFPPVPFPNGPSSAARMAASRAAMTAVAGQLDALRRGDFAAAARYQSKDLRNRIGSVAAFQHMMQKDYPEFLHSRSFIITMSGSPDFGNHIAVPVLIQTTHGKQIHALYIMVREGNKYKVEGVMGGAPFPSPSTPPGLAQGI